MWLENPLAGIKVEEDVILDPGSLVTRWDVSFVDDENEPFTMPVESLPLIRSSIAIVDAPDYVLRISDKAVPWGFQSTSDNCNASGTYARCIFAGPGSASLRSPVDLKLGLFFAGIPSIQLVDLNPKAFGFDVEFFDLDRQPNLTGVTYDHMDAKTGGFVDGGSVILRNANTELLSEVPVFMCLTESPNSKVLLPWTDGALASVSECSGQPCFSSAPIHVEPRSSVLSICAISLSNASGIASFGRSENSTRRHATYLLSARQGTYGIAYVVLPGTLDVKVMSAPANASLVVTGSVDFEILKDFTSAAVGVPFSGPVEIVEAKWKDGDREHTIDNFPSQIEMQKGKNFATLGASLSLPIQGINVKQESISSPCSIMLLEGMEGQQYDLNVTIPGRTNTDPNAVLVSSILGSVHVIPNEASIQVNVGGTVAVECEAKHLSSVPLPNVQLEVKFELADPILRLLALVKLLLGRGLSPLVYDANSATNITGPDGVARFSVRINEQAFGTAKWRVRCINEAASMESAASEAAVTVANPVSSVDVSFLQGDDMEIIYVLKSVADVAVEFLRPKVCMTDLPAVPGLVVRARAFAVDDTLNVSGSRAAHEYNAPDELKLIWREPALTGPDGCVVLEHFAPTAGASGNYAFVFAIAGTESTPTEIKRVVNENLADFSSLAEFKKIVYLMAPLTLPFFVANSVLVSTGVSFVAGAVSLVVEIIIIVLSVISYADSSSRGASDDPFFVSLYVVMLLCVILSACPLAIVGCAVVAKKRRQAKDDRVSWRANGAGKHMWQGYDSERRYESAVEHVAFLMRHRPMRDTEGKVASARLRINPFNPWYVRAMTSLRIRFGTPPRTGAFLERKESVWFPTRLVASAALSFLISILAFIFIMLVAELIKAELERAFDLARNQAELDKYRFRLASEWLSARQASNDGPSYLEPIAAVVMHLTNPCFSLERLKVVQQAIFDTAFGAAVISCLLVCGIWCDQLSEYRANVFRLRHGDYSQWGKDLPSAGLSPTFIGNTVVMSFLGFVFFASLFWILLLVISYEPLRSYLWEALGTFAWVSALISAIQMILVRLGGMILCDGPSILYPRLFNLFDFVVTFFSIAGAVGRAIFRVVASIFLMPVSIVRFDAPFTSSKSMAMLDAAFGSYKSMLIADAQMNNPVVVVFCKSLLDQTAASSSGTKATDLEMERSDHMSRSAKRARNRWQLAVLLVRNPSLRAFRRRSAAASNLTALPIDDFDSESDESNDLILLAGNSTGKSELMTLPTDDYDRKSSE